MEAYEFYCRDSIKGKHLCGMLPERRTDPARITQESILNWGRRYFGNTMNFNDIFFIHVTIDKNTGRISRPNRKIILYKIFYKNYEFKRGEFKGILTERRKDLRGKTQFESGTRWARLNMGSSVKDKQAIFVVPDELDLSEPGKDFKN